MSQYESEADRLRSTLSEYRQTVQVLAVVAEQLLNNRDKEELVLEDALVLDAPDIVAWHDDETKTIHITVER